MILRLIFAICAAILLAPAFALGQDEEDVDVTLEVKKIEPGKEPPSTELQLAGIPEKGALYRFSPKGPFDWISQHPLTLTAFQFAAPAP